MRKVIAILEVDDDRAIKEDLGTLGYLEREFGWLDSSGIRLVEARVMDVDDPEDSEALSAAAVIFDHPIE